MYSTILVPVDGSERAEKILSHVEDLAKNYNAKLIFLQVVEPPTMAAEGAAMQYGQEFDKLNAKAKSYVSGLAEKFRQKQLQAESRVENGPVVEAILEVAKDVGAELIAVASHGRGGLARVFYGSVAASLIHRIDRPLLLIRSRGE